MDNTFSDPAFRTAISYIDKSREYYAAQGYTVPYRWATNDDAPFTPLLKPLNDCTVGLVTTSFPHLGGRPDGVPRPEKKPYAQPMSPAPDRMFTADLSWDKKATHTDDTESFLPIARLQEHAASGRIGQVADRFYGVPTQYSQRLTSEHAATIVDWCRDDRIDAALLVPL